MLITNNWEFLNHPWLALRDCTKSISSLARRYVLVNDRSHRVFATASVLLFALAIFLFISYATVEKMQLTNNFLYGEVKFSFVDWGYPESLGYTLTLLSAIFFLRYAIVFDQKHWLAWSAICLIILLDDSMRFHETIGTFLVAKDGVSAQIGDLIGFALMGTLIAILWLVGLWLIPKEKQEIHPYLLFSVYLALLIFAGVGIDFLHGVLKNYIHVSETLMTLLEDGSELALQVVFSISAYGMWRLKQSSANLN